MSTTPIALFKLCQQAGEKLHLLQHSQLTAKGLTWARQAVMLAHLEHLASTFTVAGGNEWRMHIQEAAGLEEGVCGMGQGIADARNSPNDVGARPQVQPISQAFHALALFAQRVFATAVVALTQP